MGHYGDQYLSTEEENKRQDEKELRVWIQKAIADMDKYDLKLVHEVAINVDKYQSFFEVIGKRLR